MCKNFLQNCKALYGGVQKKNNRYFFLTICVTKLLSGHFTAHKRIWQINNDSLQSSIIMKNRHRLGYFFTHA